MHFDLEDILEVLSEYEGRALKQVVTREPTRLLSKELRVERDGVKYFSVFLEIDVTGNESNYPINPGCSFTSSDGYCFITTDGRSVVRCADVMTEDQLQEAIG
tara:strand:- start:279 stop:587 length:309 start_codon:yes stop_codon:yes gene_type:complete